MARRGELGGEAGPEVLSVSAALEQIQGLLEELGDLWIAGEIFEYRGPHSSGHTYFKLRDEEATLDVKLWRSVAPRALRCPLEEGRKVRVHGRFDVWPRRGSLSFILDRVEDLGVGDLARRFEELRRRLKKEGLFEAERKRALPERPQRVGLLTAFPSAAAADVLRTWEEGRAPFPIWLRPCRVQGEGAAEDLVRAIAEMGRARPDVLLLTRGGGSLEDLWAFNEERVVRAVAASPVPVLCAVGHESDVTLADFAADDRAKTPTAGAALLAAGWRDVRAEVAGLGGELAGAVEALVSRSRLVLERCGRRLQDQRPDRRLARLRNRLNEADRRLLASARLPARRARRRLLRSLHRLHAVSPVRRAALFRARLEGLRARLASASPEALLQRGYALVEVPGRPGFLRDATKTAPGDALRIRLSRGALAARVEAVEPGS